MIAQETAVARPGPIPLPAHLEHCGCPHAAAGRHRTKCVPAQEHDALRLQDRVDYEPGRSFRAISWEYPLRMTTTIRIDVEVDPELYIAQHLDAYRRFEPESGYEDWEKPILFLSSQLEEDADVLTAFDGGRHVSRSASSLDDVEEYPRWNAAATQRLHAALGLEDETPTELPIVDPNQGRLIDDSTGQ